MRSIAYFSFLIRHVCRQAEKLYSKTLSNIAHTETRCAPSSGAINGAYVSSFHTYARLVRMDKSGTKAKLRLTTRPHRTATCADSHMLRCHGWPSAAHLETRCAPARCTTSRARASSFHMYAGLVRMEKRARRQKN